MLNYEQKRRDVAESIKFQELCERLGYTDLLDKDKNYMQVKYTPIKKENFVWIGINPEVGTYTMEALYSHAISKMPFRAYELVVEQHTDGGIRPHLHILAACSGNSRKNHIITRMAKIFDIQENFVQVRITNSSSLVDKYKKYLRGEKTDSKQDNVEKDRVDREKYNIPHIYICPSQ